MTPASTQLIQQARQAWGSGHTQAARRLLQEAVRLDPGNPAAWRWLARIAVDPNSRQAYQSQAEVVSQPATAPVALPPRPEPAIPIVRADQSPAEQRRWRNAGPLARGLLFACVLALLLGAGYASYRYATTFPAGIQDVASLASVPPAASARPEAVGAGETAAPSSSDRDPAAANEVAVAKREAIAAAGANFKIGGQPLYGATATAQRQLEDVEIAAALGDSLVTPSPEPTSTLAATTTPVPTEPPPTAIAPTPAPPAEQADAGQAVASPRPASVGPQERWIDVNLTSQTLAAYEGDQPVLESLISSGTWQHPTVVGEFHIWVTYESQDMSGYLLGYDYYLPNVPYVMYFFRDYAIHGTYWHNNFGTPMSHGCVNMNTPDAGWLYNWADVGTLVNVHY